jgi:hypothetical protein
MVMEAIGVKNWRTYSAGLNELAEFGFIKIIEKSQNQYSSNIIAIVNFTKAHTKPLDKALSNHHTNHSQTTVSIDKQDNKEQIDNIILFNYKKCSDIEFVEELSKFKDLYTKKTLNDFYFYWSDKNEKGKMKLAMQDTFEINKRLVTWKNNEIKFSKSETLDARNPKNLPVEL